MEQSELAQPSPPVREDRETATIRFAGDSGDGMQITGDQFTVTSALVGNDINTFPDYPAEIRAPAGTLPGVSGFQLSFSHHDIHTPGDKVNVLVAMNPAALKVNLEDVEQGGILIINTDSFSENDLKKAAYANNPLESGELAGYRVVKIGLTTLTLNAVQEVGIPKKQATRCKNMFALGVVFWLYGRPLEHTAVWIENKFGHLPEVAKANRLALQAGYNLANTMELFTDYYRVKPATLPPGVYRQITGNQALALGCVAASVQAKRPLLYSSYPITPASDILHELAKHQNFGVRTFQAEDEIAAICATVGASFGGILAATGTSGPGLLLKGEGISLAVMAELPLVVIDVQRAGPSTGMPTKTEQADLLAAIHGRHGECPLVVLAPQTPGDCFSIGIEAFRIALKYMTPVIILSDGYLANGAEPWLLPEIDELPDLEPTFHQDPEGFSPYLRDPETLARLWAIPGTPGLEHRLGGIEKDSATGNVSYDPINHQKMVDTRNDKIQGIAKELALLEVNGPQQGDLLVVGWGGTYGAITSAVESLQAEGKSIASVHLRYLYPFQKNLGAVLKNYKKVLVSELNLGQLCQMLRAEFLVDAIPFNKVQGKPFLISELRDRMLQLL
ncbi:MAG: 2-oxoacid:acceptor oxidoreductase subunit alpha [SAR324 cluster bacterium]|nr:2-oxoacid:acceptor oxidoreductase subunit alpha [SAR324 cluster bacterium]